MCVFLWCSFPNHSACLSFNKPVLRMGKCPLNELQMYTLFVNYNKEL